MKKVMVALSLWFVQSALVCRSAELWLEAESGELGGGCRQADTVPRLMPGDLFTSV